MMKNAFSTSISAPVFKRAGLALALLLAIAPPAFAAEGAPAAPIAGGGAAMGRISVVDIDYLVANSKAGKSIRAQLDKQRDNYRGQIEKQEATLEKGRQALIAEQNTASKEEFLEKRKAFDQQVDGAQRAVQQRQKAFYDAHAAALEKLRESIVKIVADVAGKNNISLVLNRQEVVLVDAKMDITKEILDRLDATINSIPVTIK